MEMTILTSFYEKKGNLIDGAKRINLGRSMTHGLLQGGGLGHVAQLGCPKPHSPAGTAETASTPKPFLPRPGLLRNPAGGLDYEATM